MDRIKVLVLGKMFPENTEQEVLQNSKAFISGAANAHLSMILEGLDLQLDCPPDVINILPVPSYPKRYKQLWVKGFSYEHTPGAQDWNLGYCNLTLWKKRSIRQNLKKKVLSWMERHQQEKTVLFLYTLDNAFLEVSRIAKKKYPQLHVCAIVPDLPAFTNIDKGGSCIYALWTKWNAAAVRKNIKWADSFVFLTRAMKDYFEVKKPFLVMEGLVSSRQTFETAAEETQEEGICTITYTGTFTKKYGIMDLVDAFSLLPDPDLRLVLCGSGEMEAEVRKRAEEDPRILYYGAVSHREAIKLQQQAAILVNPRKAGEEFTKYSFPSKIMEYMVSGRPVLCFKLPGMPEEYDPYLNYFEGETPEQMAREMLRLCRSGKDKLQQQGKQAREFVLGCKNNRVQAQKLIDLVSKKRLLFCISSLYTGGSTTSLLALLDTIDPSRYEVDLILSENQGDYLDSIPEHVHLLPPAIRQGNPKAVKRRKLVNYLFRGYLLRALLYRQTRGKRYGSGMFQLMAGHARCSVARKLPGFYDAAIGYMEGFSDYYVHRKVNARKKLAYIHVNYEQSGLDPRLDHKVYEDADSVVLVSGECKQIFDQNFPEFAHKSVVVENLASKHLILKQAGREAEGFAPDPAYFTVVTAARLQNSSKALDRAVLTLTQLKKEGFKVRWYVFGEGPDRAALAQMIKENELEHDFFLMGNRKNIYPYLKKGDLFVLTSRSEGKPMAVTEALILGIPVLVTKYASAAAQIPEGAGWIVENSDGPELFYGIRDLLTQPRLLEDAKKRLEKGIPQQSPEAFYQLL